MFIRISDKKYPLSEKDVKREFPRKAFRQPFSPPDGYKRVLLTRPPEYDPVYYVLQEIAPVEVEGVWTQQWGLVPQDSAEIKRLEDVQNVKKELINKELKVAEAKESLKKISVEAQGKKLTTEELQEQLEMIKIIMGVG